MCNTRFYDDIAYEIANKELKEMNSKLKESEKNKRHHVVKINNDRTFLLEDGSVEIFIDKKEFERLKPLINFIKNSKSNENGRRN